MADLVSPGRMVLISFEASREPKASRLSVVSGGSRPQAPLLDFASTVAVRNEVAAGVARAVIGDLAIEDGAAHGGISTLPTTGIDLTRQPVAI